MATNPDLAAVLDRAIQPNPEEPPTHSPIVPQPRYRFSQPQAERTMAKPWHTNYSPIVFTCPIRAGKGLTPRSADVSPSAVLIANGKKQITPR